MIASANGRLGRPNWEVHDRRVNESAEPTSVTFLVAYGPGTPVLAAGLERAGLEVRTFDRCAAALAEAQTLQPELILVGDADEDGPTARFLQKVQETQSDSIVLFLSPSGDPDRVDEVLEAGAHDVVAPPHSVRAILLRRQVQVRRRYLPQLHKRMHVARQLTLGGLTVDPSTREVTDGSDVFTLSGRELELLVCLMEARGAVISRDRLLAEIWGDEQESEAVLDATVHRLRKRLNDISGSNLVATVRGVGYRFRTS